MDYIIFRLRRIKSNFGIIRFCLTIFGTFGLEFFIAHEFND
jgi:hypothetical protein